MGLGVTHGLQCYTGTFGFEDNFDAATAAKKTCHSYHADVVYDGCFKRPGPYGWHRGCERLQVWTSSAGKLEPVPKIGGCTNVTDLYITQAISLPSACAGEIS